jgi:hypothetical protein
MTVYGPERPSTATTADRIDVQVRFPLSVALISAAVLIALTVAYWWFGGTAKETILFFAAGAAGAGTVVTAFYTARTLNLSLRQEARVAAL